MPLQSFETLPAGIVPIKDYRSLGASLVECHHDLKHRVTLVERGGVDTTFCRLCRTVAPDQPVKMLAVIPTGQTPLF